MCLSVIMIEDRLAPMHATPFVSYAMAAGNPVFCKLSFHWQQGVSVKSTSNSTCGVSWRASSLRIEAPTNNYSYRQPHHHDTSLSWACAFVSCRLRIPKLVETTPARTLKIVSENMDRPERENELDYESRKVTTDWTQNEAVGVGKPFWTWNLMLLLDRVADYADAQTERGMRKRRAFYKAEDWVQHRSSKRHLRHMLSAFSSRVIISLVPPVATVTCISAVVAIYNTLVDGHYLPSYFPLFHTSALPYQLTAPAVALLLVFRTEASYSRYDEGRRTWTKVFACTKDFSRQCLAWIRHPHDLHRRMDLQHFIMAFPVALKCHLLDGSDLSEDLRLLLDEEDLALVMSSGHRPNCLIQLMTQGLRHVQISDNQRNLMDANITQFNESVSVCERIMRAPIPLSYTRLTSRVLILWHLTLPLVLWDECKWTMVFATFFSACTLFCIEEVGVLIEEPFPMLSLDKMCAVAHQNVQELVELQTVTDEYLKAKEKKTGTQIVGEAGTFGKAPSNGLPSMPLK